MKDALKILLAGKEYFYLRSDREEVVRRLQMYSPLRTEWATVIMQTWVEEVNPDEPEELKVPI